MTTDISQRDRKVLGVLIKSLSPLVNLNPIGHYSGMDDDELWLTLVGQVSVMGSARPIERLKGDADRYEEFREAASFATVAKKSRAAQYLSGVLRTFSVTRFPQKCA